MQKLFRFFLLLNLVAAPIVMQGAIGEVQVDVDKNTVPVRVSGNTAELNKLAVQAFGAHGRYRLVASGFLYDIRFSAVTATQVRVDITQGSAGTPVASQIVSGPTPRAALMRAADAAVVQTNGQGLKGFFTARLAFIIERGTKKEICTSDLFMGTGETKQITHDNAQALSPRWSPDGSRIIYTSFYKTGFPDIFLLDPATARHEIFAQFAGTNQGARFSPNGQQVAMVLSSNGTPEIFVSNAQGKQPSRRTRSDQVKASPCWSPDGSRIVFAMDPGPQLYVMSAAGGSMQKLSTGSTYAAEPDWSRASPNKIACTVRLPGGKYQIAVYDESLRKTDVVSKATFDGIEPSWLADGRHLVYTARDRSTNVLCILDTETGKSTPISAGIGSALQASVWTP